MNRDQKSIVIDTLKNDFLNSKASFVVGYKGLTVKQLQALRKELHAQHGTFKVAKGRLIKRAVMDIDNVTDLSPYIKEQIGVVFVNDQAPAVAKVLHDFAKKNNALLLVAGYFDSQVVRSEMIARIATLPSKEVLLAQLCGTLNAPVAKFTYLLNMQI